MIKVIDYGMGNTASIINMISKVGGKADLCSKPEELNNASAIILPGVGAFDNGIVKLKNLGLIEAMKSKVIEKKIPFLGICLGMHLLFEKSEEGIQAGLGWLKGSVTRFDFSFLSHKKKLNIPHMGWNIVRPKSNKNLYLGAQEEIRFYFVHSYHVNCENLIDISATTFYGYEFPCSVHRNNIWGTQFHPEKSHRFGMSLFKNFLREVKNA